MGYDIGRKTEQEHWDNAWQLQVNPRLPSKLNVSVMDTTRLLKKYIKPGNRYIEIGCAPGKILAWATSVLKADAVGLDYSEVGIRQCKILFDALGLKIDLRHADLFNNDLPKETFDVVASFGVIEHFDDARLAVQNHLDLVAPGGVALIVVPNYRSIYGSLQRWCDLTNLELHNLEIMTPSALTALVSSKNASNARAYYFGSVSPWLVNFEKCLPRAVAKLISLSVNTFGLFQPITINALAPMLVLEIKKNK